MTTTRQSSLRARLLHAPLLCLLSLPIALIVASCRGSDDNRESPTGYIAIHAQVREVLAGFQGNDLDRLSHAMELLGEINDRQELLVDVENVHSVDLSPRGRYLIIGLGRSLGGSKQLVLDARSGQLLLGVKGYGASFSPDDRWLGCLQHRYATPEPGADVGAYEVLLLVDLGRVRGSSLNDPTVFRSIVNDLEGRLTGGQTSFVRKDRIAIDRQDPHLHIEYTLEGEVAGKEERRWKFLKLF